MQLANDSEGRERRAQSLAVAFVLVGAVLAALIGSAYLAAEGDEPLDQLWATLILPVALAVVIWLGLTRFHNLILVAVILLDVEALLTAAEFPTGSGFAALLVFLAVGVARLGPGQRFVRVALVLSVVTAFAATILQVTVSPVAGLIPAPIPVVAGLIVTGVTVAVLQWVFLSRQQRVLGEIRAAEFQAASARGMLRSILAASPVAIVSTDAQGCVTTLNAAAEELTGVSEADARGRPLAELMPATDDESRALLAALQGNESLPAEPVRHLYPDGRFVDERSLFAPLRDPDGSVVGAVVVTEDVTDRLKLESQLRQAQKMETLGQLSGAIAHDFNNMLQAIRGYAELTHTATTEPETRGSMDEIKRAADRAAELTRQLLTFSQPGRPGARQVNVSDAVASAVPMIRRLVGPRVEVVTQLAPSLNAILIDPTQLEQAIVNLCVNARDAMPAGGKVTILTTPAGDRQVSVCVRDTGHGIAPEVREHIFEPFFSTKRDTQGTGLGLTIVFQVVKAAGGTIAVESEPGAGAAFTLTFPVTETPTTEAVEPPTRDRSGSEAILVVDDELPIRTLVERVLRSKGYQVYTAANADEATEIWRDHGPAISLLLTDATMPGRSGPALIRDLTAQRPSLASILISGHLPGDAHADLGEGMYFLQKPFTVEELLAAVSQALDTPGSVRASG